MKLDDICIYKLALETIDSEIERDSKELNNMRDEVCLIADKMLKLRESDKRNTDEYKVLVRRKRHLIYKMNKIMQKLKKESDDIGKYKKEIAALEIG